jgi:hypothetical protein
MSVWTHEIEPHLGGSQHSHGARLIGDGMWELSTLFGLRSSPLTPSPTLMLRLLLRWLPEWLADRVRYWHFYWRHPEYRAWLRGRR